MRRKTPDDYHALAKERGFHWLGPEVPNARTKTGWKCAHGHKWEAVYDAIQRGGGCPTCAVERRSVALRKKPTAYHTLAEERGFRWPGPEVPNRHTKTGWECEHGHQWETTYGNIQQGRGCPVCAIATQAERQRKKPEDYYALAEERGFRWLGPEVPNTKTKTVWECEQGHCWEANYSNIQQGRGCPYCSNKVPLSPLDYHTLAQERGFRWLGPEVSNNATKTVWECEDGHQWEAAYGNVQQGKGCPFCAGTVPKTSMDYYALAEERGFRWLGPEVPNTAAKTGWECERGHQWETNYLHIQGGTGCPFCAGNVPKTPMDYHTLAQERGFRWLGPEVPNAITKTTWECEQGHHWEVAYNGIQQGRGCPYCSNKVPLTPLDYHALAQERGFRWLGPEVPNNATKTGWECEHGHQWEAAYGNIQQGRGCSHCVDIVEGHAVSQVQRELCKMLGGKLNHPFGSFRVDVAIEIDGVAIAVEYDSWYWHGGREQYDSQRDREIISAGWRVLHVKSNAQLPTRAQLDAALARLLAGESQVEIVLDDWGVGQTRIEFD